MAKQSIHGMVPDVFTEIYKENDLQTFSIVHSNFCNSSGGNVTLRVCMTAKGEAPSTSNAMLWDQSVTSKANFNAFDGAIVCQGHSLWAMAGAPNAICYVICGDHV